jgi:hypothetical protein
LAIAPVDTKPAQDAGGSRLQPITVEKRKWDGSVAARTPAWLVTASPGARYVWVTLPGATRERPRRGTTEVVRAAEISVAGPEWWVASGLTNAGGEPAIARLVVDASMPAHLSEDGTLVFVDLDLDLEITGRDIALRDLGDFARRAEQMDYPQAVRRRAWSGLRAAERRARRGEWPFDGSLDAALAEAMSVLGR